MSGRTEQGQVRGGPGPGRTRAGPGPGRTNETRAGVGQHQQGRGRGRVGKAGVGKESMEPEPGQAKSPARAGVWAGQGSLPGASPFGLAGSLVQPEEKGLGSRAASASRSGQPRGPAVRRRASPPLVSPEPGPSGCAAVRAGMGH